MKREDLVRLARTQLRTAFLVLFVLLGGLGLSLSGALERIDPSWSPSWVIPALGVFAIVVMVGFAHRGLIGLPRCPHCRRLLTGWLLNIAIASGNCGYCGKSVED
jgi:hypothetical protein